MRLLYKKHQHVGRKYFISYSIFLSLSLVLVFFNYVRADFSSASFILENPVNTISGGESQSSSFRYISNTDQIESMQASSVNFSQNPSFLYFPLATSPVLSVTPGNAQVLLNWTSALGTFANVTSYEVGVSTVSGSGFSYSNVGNVLNYTKTGLTNNVTYFFKIRVYASGALLSESGEVSSTPVGGNSGNSGGGGGGGGGGGNNNQSTSDSSTGVNFSGRAYPLSKVSILKDGQLVLNTIAGPDSNFSAKLNGLSSGEYNFSVYGTDKNGVRSGSFTFQVYITSGVVTNIGGIFIAPTISVDKSEVKKGDNIVIFGQSSPDSQVVISVNSKQEFFKNVKTDKDGAYLHNFDTSVLEMGSHSARSKSLKDNEISSFGELALFAVGTKNVLANNSKELSKCDLNEDGRCNLIDFSIAAFWYKKNLSDDMLQKEKKYLSGNGKIDLVDFSIMAFYWTG